MNPTGAAQDDRRALLLRALQTVEDLKGKLRARDEQDRDPIAIVGLGCRFPGGASGPDAYWEVLRNRVDAVREIPIDRWGSSGVPKGDAVWHAGLVDGLDQFDPRFFSMSAREAVSLDPQQRMLLEVAWEALEHAAINPQQLMGSSTGVFIGITGRDYAQVIRDAGSHLLDVYTATGNASNAAAGRLSFVLGLQGPSVSIDTACSSSLVAVHLACQSLRTNECTMALAAGVNALLTPDPFICFANWGMMAPDGKCKTFDASADGFVRSEGCGLIVLKRLSKAVADGNRVLAIIRGSAVNQDGKSSGLTVPNGPAQEAVIRQALAQARLAGSAVDYVEAHGTGTTLGDPIEAHALAAVLGPEREPVHPLVLGSVKTNLGHLESAAGIAGLIKVVLSLQHEWIPPHLHFKTLSPQIDFGAVPIEIPVDGRAWIRGERPRIAGVSSFGFSGTNAHVVVEESPGARIEPAVAPRPLTVVTLTARSAPALQMLAARWADHAGANSDERLRDIAFTANVGRARFSERAAIVTDSTPHLNSQLLRLAREESNPAIVRGQATDRRTRIGFLFPGQGAQLAGVGRDLYDHEPVFRKALDECDEILAGELDVRLFDLWWGNATDRLDDTRYTQPALFAFEWALSTLWRGWGVEPSVVLGHSVGEYVAACVAGACSLAGGLRLIARRARLMGDLPSGVGSMAAVQGPPEAVRAAIEASDNAVCIAAYNGPENVVIAGDRAAIAAAAARCTEAGLRVDVLRVSHAFHSPLIAPMETAFEGEAAAVQWQPLRRTLISSVTGAVAAARELDDPTYWGRQIRQPVQFASALRTLEAQRCSALIEIGPGTTTLGLVRANMAQPPVLLPSLRKGKEDYRQLMESVAAAFVNGAPIDWDRFEEGRESRRVALPTYPFERQRYWVDAEALASGRSRGPREGHPLLGERLDLAGRAGSVIWLNEISTTTLPWVADHTVQGHVVLPATAYIEMAAAVAADTFGPASAVTIRRFAFHKPLLITPKTRYELQVTLRMVSTIGGRVEVYSRRVGVKEWTFNASADIEAGAAEDGLPGHVAATVHTAVNSDDFYGRFAELGNDWGELFRLVDRAEIGSSSAETRVLIPETIGSELNRYRLHPAVADACGHALAAIRAFAPAGSSARAMVGEGIEEVRIHRSVQTTKLICRAELGTTDDPSLLVGHVAVYDEEGRLLSQVRGARLRYLEEAREPTGKPGLDHWFYEVTWSELRRLERHGTRRNWLLIGGPLDFAEQLRSTLEAAGVRASLIRESDDLTSALQRSGDTAIAYLDGLTAHAPAAADSAGDATAVSGLFAIVQHLRGSGKVASVFVITRGAQTAGRDVTEDGLWQTPLWGIGRTLAAEHADLWGGLIDMDIASSDADNARHLVECLLAGHEDDQIALRDGAVLGARLTRAARPSSTRPPVRSDAAYLVTGGISGLGLEAARWLAAAGARRLILASRSALPPRNQWKTLVTGDSRYSTVAAIREIERLGATVIPVSLDIGDAAATADFLARYHDDEQAPIRGIVHSAGVLEHAPATLADSDLIERVFRPKLAAWTLHQIFPPDTLDFFVLFSSASAVLGSPMLSAYAGANSFLDGMAAMRQSSGGRATSANWGVWTEAGMATRFAAQSVQSLLDRGMGGMTTAEGFDALERLLAEGSPTTAVLPVDWAAWSRLFPAYLKSPFLARVRDGVGVTDEARPAFVLGNLRYLPAVDRSERVQSAIAEALAGVAGFPVERVDSGQPVTDYGLDSLMSLEFKNRLQALFGISIDVLRILEGPSVEWLVGHVLEKIAVAQAAPGSQDAEESDESLYARLDDLSDEEIDAALARLD
jgi:acyl transferase domain-containing protein